MVEMTFYVIPSADEMMSMIHSSRGKVLIELNGKEHDVKNDELAEMLLRKLVDRREGVNLHIYDADDGRDFLNYMLEAA